MYVLRDFEMPRRSDTTSRLMESMELVVPWLTSQELAAISETCKSLNLIAATIAAARLSDAARGMEPQPIPFLSSTYSFFLYTPSSVFSSSSSSPTRQPWPCVSTAPSQNDALQTVRFDGAIGCGHGCACAGDRCPCLGINSESECGASCECGSGCRNRATQSGVRVRLGIVWNVNKGWCLLAQQFIPINTFVCEYAGELLSNEEAKTRQRKYDEDRERSGKLMVVREHLPSGKACLRVNIDATRIGNVARFINHSCDGGNLHAVLVRASGSLLPRLCFFASKDVEEGQELTFSYGEVGRPRNDARPCYCATSACSGWLPYENT